MSQRRLLVTSALPYANGHIHIGHLVEYIQTDIWVRFQKLRGQRCAYVCADDTHGTAIMIRARQEGRTEEQLIAAMSQEHQRDFSAFDVAFDHYGSTNSPANRQLCEGIWQSLRQADLVRERSVEQLFDPEAGTFLADRFVKGTCPKCGAQDQYGDSCDKCGAVYSPAELKDARSTLSGARPELRSATHLFVALEPLRAWLREWTRSGTLQPEVANYLDGHFLGEELRDWDVSRPAPYFGFEIPDAPGNYWYVWFDAPIGYIASTQEWCQLQGEPLEQWWKSADCEVHHFIGKDITYFHTLFWPAMLKTAGYSLPTKVHIHGFLTVDGEKMSKSKGTFIRAADFAAHVDPQALRYFYASKLGSGTQDLDLGLDEFIAKVNADLVGKVVNLASRTAGFIKTQGLSAQYPDDGGLFAYAAAQSETIAAAYEGCDFQNAMRLIMTLADRANEFVEREAPWSLKKDPAQAERLQAVCSIALNLFRQISIYLAPVLPRLATQVGALFGQAISRWDDAQTPLCSLQLQPFSHLMSRITRDQVDQVVSLTRGQVTAANVAITPAMLAGAKAVSASKPAVEAEPLAETCSFEQFCAVDLRVARVQAAETVAKSDKLLRLTLDLGPLGTRNVLAGIAKAYKPEQLVERLVVMVANLAPRTMGKFGTSEGMVIAAGPGGADIWVLSPDSGAQPGQRIH